MTIQAALAEGKRLLKIHCPEALIDTPDLDATLLLAHTLLLSREKLILRWEDPIAEADYGEYLNLLERRRSGECIAYILGNKEFRGLQFTVNPNVLVPRPETEILLEAAMDCIDSLAAQKVCNPSVLDLCTGSGALAISLKNERPQVYVTASDISTEALETAYFNAALLLEDQRFFKGEQYLLGASVVNSTRSVRFILSDLFEDIPEKFNIIISNPPYIPTGQLAALAPELQREPRLALDGGEDGLALIRKIILQAEEHLLPNGVLLLEASPEQMPEIKTLFERNCFRKVSVRKDLAGRERVISGYAAGCI